MDFAWWEYLLVTGAACVCSFINAIAGGGILILYPALTTIGVPPVPAVANLKLGLFPGSIAAIVAQRDLLKGQTKRIWLTLITAFFGALLGSWLLAHFGDESFKFIVPWLIIFASLLMAFNKPLKAWIAKHTSKDISSNKPAFYTGNFLFGIYSGYFGAGHGFLFFGCLSFFYKQGMKYLNALRQVVVTASHVASAIFFIFGTALISWKLVGFIFIGSALGGFLGGRYSEIANPKLLKRIVVAFGLLFGIYLLLKNWGTVPAL